MEKESGVLAGSSPFEKLSFDICKTVCFLSFLFISFHCSLCPFPAWQISFDVEHSESVLAKSLLSTMIQNLSEAGVRELDLLFAAKAEEGWPSFPCCESWGELSFTQVRKLVKLLPSILRTLLKPSIIKRGCRTLLQHCVASARVAPTLDGHDCDTVTPALAVRAILDAFLAFGASLVACFAKSVTPQEKEMFWPVVLKGRQSLLNVFFFDFNERPNVHLAVHLPREVHLHGTAHQTEVSVKEMVHKRPKYTASHGNHHQIARDMLLHENADQALKFLLRGGVDGLVPGQALMALLEDEALKPVLRGWLNKGLLYSVAFLQA